MNFVIYFPAIISMGSCAVFKVVMAKSLLDYFTAVEL